MIYEETYNFLLKNVSSTEFNVCLYSLLKIDWDGYVRADVNEFAQKVGTTKKYMKEIMKRFMSTRKGRRVFIRENTVDGELLRFTISKTQNLGFNPVTDRYCKKYKFFYTEGFKNLPINAKRLLLMGAFRMSVSKSERVSIPVEEIVPNSHNGGVLPFTKQRLQQAIQEIQQSSLKDTVKITTASNIFTKKEVVSFEFERGTLEEYMENHVERELLRMKLYEAGFQHYLHNDFCIEIEKVGKYLYRSLLANEKAHSKSNGVVTGAKDELLKIARYVYNKSIEKLAQGLNSKKEELAEPKQVSAYFSSIMHEVMLDEVAKYRHQEHSIDTLLRMTRINMSSSDERYFNEEDFTENVNEQSLYENLSTIYAQKEHKKYIAEVLEEWCENWVISRVKGVKNEEKTLKGEVVKERLTTLRQKVYEKVDGLIQSVHSKGNKLVSTDDLAFSLQKMKERIRSYFAMHLDDERLLNSVPFKNLKLNNMGKNELPY